MLQPKFRSVRSDLTATTGSAHVFRPRNTHYPTDFFHFQVFDINEKTNETKSLIETSVKILFSSQYMKTKTYITCGHFDSVPLCNSIQQWSASHGEYREIRRRAVGVHMSEATCDISLAIAIWLDWTKHSITYTYNVTYDQRWAQQFEHKFELKRKATFLFCSDTALSNSRFLRQFELPYTTHYRTALLLVVF